MKYGMIFPMNCQNIKTLKRSFYGSSIVTNSLDPDQAQHFGSKLLSADGGNDKTQWMNTYMRV